MGTVWFFAGSVQTSEELAMRAIVGGSICIIAILLAYTLTRKRLKNRLLFYFCIVTCVCIVSIILLSEAITSITTIGSTL